MASTSSMCTNITRQYFASSITYADGKPLSITYDTAQLTRDTTRTFYRPNKVTSATEFNNMTTYQGSNINTDQAAEGKTEQATLYSASTPTTPLSQLTYNAAGTTLARRRDVRHPSDGKAKLNGEMVYLWRAVDQEGENPESYIARTGYKEVALTFMKKALKRCGSPE